MADHVHESWWLIESTVAPVPLYYAGHVKPGFKRLHMHMVEDAAKAVRFPDEWGAKYALATFMGVDVGKASWPLDKGLSHLIVREHIFDYTLRGSAGNAGVSVTPGKTDAPKDADDGVVEGINRTTSGAIGLP